MFADDTKIYQAILDSNDVHLTDLRTDLNQLQEWSDIMQMRFHPDKCKTMHFGNHNPNRIYTMKKSDGSSHTLETVEEEKDLGVTIDKGLSFSKHIQAQINKANRVLGALKHTFSAIDQTSFPYLYKSLIRPHLEYASVIWSPKFKSDRDAIEKVQKRATRLVSGISQLPYEQRLRILGLPTLQYRRKRADIVQTFKIIKGIDSVQYTRECQVCGNSMFKPALSTHTRGHSLKLQIQHQQGARKHFLPARVSSNWNKLSQDTVNSDTVTTFKTRLEREWSSHRDKYYYHFTY